MKFNKDYIASAELNEFIKKLGQNLKGCEIGVCHGENLCHMLESCENIESMIAVDPYISYQDYGGYVDEDKLQGPSFVKLKELPTIVKQNLDSIGMFHKVNFKQVTSDEAALTIEDESLDFVFIDGNHSYLQVKKDLDNYYEKVKKGGIFSGHDFSLTDVNKAILEFLDEKNISSSDLKLLKNDSWFLFKN